MSTFYRIVFLFCLLSTYVVNSAESQVLKDSVTTFKIAKNDIPDYSAKRRITGTVKGRNSKKPIGNATAYVLETKQTATTNSEGYFELYLPDSILGKNVTVYFKRYANYQYGERVIIKTKKLPAKVYIKLDDAVSVGGVRFL
jgi:hypothetical protein